MKPSKPRSSGPRRSGGNDRPRRFDNDDRPRTRFDEERAAERRARGEGPRSDGPRSDRPRSDRPRRDESLTARPSRDGSRDNRGGFARDGERSERGPGRGFGDRNRSEGGERSFRDRNERGPGRGGDRNRDGGYGGDRGERSFRPRGPGKDPSIQVWRPEDDDIGNRDPGVGQDRGNRGRGERSDRPRDFADRPRSDRPREDRPRGDRPRRDDNDRPRRDFDRPRREFADRDPFDRNSPRPPRFEREDGMESGDQDAAPAKPENAQRRDETRIHGVNACKAFFAVRPQDLIRVYLTQARAPQFADVMKHCVNERLAYHIIPDDELARAADTDHHEGVCFLVRKRTTLTLDEWLATVPAKGSRRVLALENVGNPHNLGAILRTAAHFGVDAVLVNAGAPVHSGAVARTAEGGFEALTLVEYRDLPAAFEKLSEAGFELIATSGEGESGLFDQKLPKRAVIWFGEEHSGLSDYVLEHADLALKIPGSGAVQSLNVSCAVAVVLAEWMRTSSK